MESIRERNNIGRLFRFYSIVGRNEIVLYEGKAITIEELHFLQNEFVQNYQIIQNKNVSIIGKNEIIKHRHAIIKGKNDIIAVIKNDLVECKELCMESSNRLHNCHDLIKVMKSKIDLTMEVLGDASLKLRNIEEDNCIENRDNDLITEVIQTLQDHYNVLRGYELSQANATNGDRLYESIRDVDAIHHLQEQTGFVSGTSNLSQETVFEEE